MRFVAALCLVCCSCARYGELALPSAPVGPNIGLAWHLTPEPVIARGASLDVLNPSVVYWRGEYLNLYSIFDGTVWHTGLSASPDGLSWKEAGKVLSPSEAWEGHYIAANGGVAVNGAELLYAYQSGEKGRTVIGVASSKDGRSWTKQPLPVLTQGPRMSWDEISLGDPYLVVAGGEIYVYYLGEDRARRQRLGVAKSSDGIHWTKARGALLELGGAGDFDENGLGEPAVFAANGMWMMLYTGRDHKEQRALGYAVSKDGRKWEKLKIPVLRGEQSWNAAVVCDPTVLVEAGRVRIWFGGGDLARPDEGLNGQIGYAELVKPE